MDCKVVVWRGELSDGSECYAAVFPALNHANGQGNTEEEALVGVADAIACFLEHIPERLKTGQAAEDEMAELVDELASEGVETWFRQVVPHRVTGPMAAVV